MTTEGSSMAHFEHRATPAGRRAMDNQPQPRVTTQQWLELVTILTVGALFFVEVRANGDLQTQLLRAKQEVMLNRSVSVTNSQHILRVVQGARDDHGSLLAGLQGVERAVARQCK